MADKISKYNTRELCNLLNALAHEHCPKLQLDFQICVQQPMIAVAQINITDVCAFDCSEIHKMIETEDNPVTSQILSLFRDRLNEKLCGIAKLLLNSQIE